MSSFEPRPQCCCAASWLTRRKTSFLIAYCFEHAGPDGVAGRNIWTHEYNRHAFLLRVQIRTHAAAAIASVPSLGLCSGMASDLYEAVSEALGGSADTDTVNDTHASSALNCGSAAGRLDLRYLPELQTQLQSALLHLADLGKSSEKQTGTL